MLEAIAEALSSQRVAARGKLVACRLDHRTRIGRLFQEGAAKIRMPRTAGDPMQAVLINTSGGLTGGDRIVWEIDAAPGASVTVTTQACEKLYRAAADHAEAGVRLSAAAGARIAWLPQETIVYDRSAFVRRLDADLAQDARLLAVEATIFGRLAMGEAVRQALFHDRWRVRVGGRLVHAEDFRIGPQVGATLQERAVAAGATAFATVLSIAPDVERLLPAAREIVGDAGGASAWEVAGSGKLLARLVASDGYRLRRRLVPLLGLLNGQAGLPKIWSF